MQVHVKLMASLRNKLPPDAKGGVAAMELPSGASVATLLEKLGISGGQIHLVMVNGGMEVDRLRPLADGDQLTVFPPVAGGATAPGASLHA